MLKRCWLLCLMLCCLTPAQAQESIVVLQSSHGGAYREFAEALDLALGQQAGRYTLQDITLGDGGSLAASPTTPALAITVGAQAAQAAIRSGRYPRLLCVLLPRYRYEELMRERPAHAGASTAIFLDQPFNRQFALLRDALPQLTEVGVLLGPDSQRDQETLQSAALTHQITLHVEHIGDPNGIIPALNRLLPTVGLLLAQPDPVVFNRDTVRPILLTAYRFQRPLLGFSQAYVNAGALLGVYSTPAHIARQVGEMLGQGIPAALPRPAYPRYFNVAVNTSVASSLRLDLPPAAVLQQRLMQQEKDERR